MPQVGAGILLVKTVGRKSWQEARATPGSAPICREDVGAWMRDTLDGMTSTLNDDHDVYNTFLAFINAKQITLTVPSASGISLLSGTDLRRLKVTRTATITDKSNRVMPNVSGLSAATFAIHHSI